MELKLIRYPQDDVTLGSLWINGSFQCFTLEDVLREPFIKVDKQTAIPNGRYHVTLTKSQRFGIVTPRLWDVPQFDAIRIHPGNNTADTEGCILVGRTKGRKSIGESRLAFDELMSKLSKATEDIWIEIERAPMDTTTQVA